MCSCNCKGGAINPGLIVLPSSGGEKYKFTVKRPLKMTQRKVGDTTHIHLEIISVVAPKVGLSVTPAFIEAGQSVSALFSAVITPGSDPIAERQVEPALAEPLTSANKFTFSVEGISAEFGRTGAHTLTATDTEGLAASATASIRVKQRSFILYSVNARLTQEELQAAVDAGAGELGDDIQEAYGAMRAYPVPALAAGLKHYIHWVYVNGDDGIGTPIDEHGSPLPVEAMPGSLSVTNQYGLVLDYRTARSSYAYGEFTFNFKF